MHARATPFGVSLLALAALVPLLAGRADPDPPAAPPADAADRPQDLILLIDVSGSMIAHDGKTPASDPEGMRWDGVQFLIDVARPEDRIALVVFASEAAVLTQAVDPSGFIELNKLYDAKQNDPEDGKGRALLKKIVQDIQTREKTIADRKLDVGDKDLPLPHFEVNGKVFDLWDGTSIKLTLDTVVHKANLLGALKPDDRDARALLLTDGNDTEPGFPDGKWPDEGWHKAHPEHPYRQTDFAYIKELGKPGKRKPDEEKKLDQLVEGWVGPFHDNKVPLITFALGGDCDKQLLESIARQSSLGGAAFHADTNAELFDQLRDVSLALRQTWWLLGPKGAGKQTFSVPKIGIWRDLGVLLYQEETADKKTRLERPEGKVEGPLVNGTALDPKSFVRLESRSHWYYSLSPEEVVRGLAPSDRNAADENVVFTVTALPGKPCTAFAALRPRLPLFAWNRPENNATFTPLDALPFEVGFTPERVNGKAAFAPEDFVVEAHVRPVADGSKNPLPDGGRLPLAATTDDRGAVYFRPDKPFIPDADPETKGRPELLGRYTVEITVRGAEGGPWKGLRIPLLPRTIEIGPYPSVALDPKEVVLRNTGPDAIRASFTASVPVQGAAGRAVAVLSARVAEGPRSPDGEVKKESFQLSQSLKLVGGKAEGAVELPAAVWSGLAPGEYVAGSIKVKPPWADDEQSIDLVVEKTRYDLSVETKSLELDLSNRRKREDHAPVAVALDTKLDAQEEVFLSTTDQAGRPPDDAKLTLTGEGMTFALPVEGLGAPMKAGRKGKADGAKLPLRVVRTDQLPLGKFTGKLWVVGKAVNPQPIDVVVSRAKVNLAGRDVAEFDLSDKEPKPVPKDIQLRLDKEPETPEAVRLSAREDGTDPPDENPKLDVVEEDPPAGKEPRQAKLPISGLQKSVMVGGDTSDTAGKVTVSLTRTDDLGPGLYKGELWAVGDGVVPRKITVQVTVDQPVAFLQGSDKPLDGALSVAALANTTLRRTLVFRKSPDAKTNIDGLPAKLKDQAGEHSLRLEGGADRLVVNVHPYDDHVDVEVKAPSSVLEGTYSPDPEDLAFDLREPKDEAPRQVKVRFKVRVAHAGVRPEETKLLLKPPDDKPCDVEYTRTFHLTTLKDADGKAVPVRWKVECAPLTKDKDAARPLDEKTDVEVSCGGRKVWPNNGGYDPVPPDTPLVLTVTARCGQADPGLYHYRLTFHSYADEETKDEAPPSSMDLDVLVPGRRVKAEMEENQTPEVGKAATLKVTVSCYGCDADKAPDGGRIALDGDGPAPTLSEGRRDGGTGGDAVVYTYSASATPTRAGTNDVRVWWPRSPTCPQGDATARAPIDARGVIETEPAHAPGRPLIVYPNEEFLLRATIDPSRLPDKDPVLHLKAVTTDAANPAEIPVELSDDGRKMGVYSGKVKLPDPGRRYKVQPAANPTGPELDPVEVTVGVDYNPKDKDSVSSGDIWYGGGQILGWWPNQEHIDWPKVLSFTNRGPGVCTWHARLRYPTDVLSDVRAANPAGPGVSTEKADLNLNLDARLECTQPGAQATEGPDGWQLSGTLNSGEGTALGLTADVPENAKKKLYEGADALPQTLKGTNGMWVELQLEWPDPNGGTIQRTLYAPVTVQASSLSLASNILTYVVLPLLLFVGVGVGVYRYRRWQKSRPQAAAAKPKKAPAGTTATPAAAEAATPADEPARPASPPGSGPRRPPRRPPGFKG